MEPTDQAQAYVAEAVVTLMRETDPEVRLSPPPVTFRHADSPLRDSRATEGAGLVRAPFWTSGVILMRETCFSRMCRRSWINGTGTSWSCAKEESWRRSRWRNQGGLLP